jgi:DNA mismatch endonuclease (patch repair protein)
MADRHTPRQRSRNMASIRKFGNASTELLMVKLLREWGITGWRRHLLLPGRPDFTFRRQRVVLFIDGCFWHACPRCNWTPKSNTRYWNAKLAGNRTKDRQANAALRRDGWTVIRIWEHALKRPEMVLAKLRKALEANSH